MTSIPDLPERYHRTRRDHATETAEDYTEAIADLIARNQTCRVSDLAGRFGVTHVTVTRTVARLQAEGLVTTEPHQPIELTDRGRQIAAESRDRHQTIYRFLIALGVDETTASIDTEGIEHHVSAVTLEKMRTWTERQTPRPT